MNLQFAGNVSPMRNDRVSRKEELVGYFTIGHSFHHTDDNLFFPRTQALLFFSILNGTIITGSSNQSL